MPTGGKLGLLYFHCSSLSLPSANPLISHFWQNGKSVSSANFLADSWPRSIVSQLTSLGRPPSASSALLLGTDPGGRDRSHNAGARCRGGSYSAGARCRRAAPACSSLGAAGEGRQTPSILISESWQAGKTHNSCSAVTQLWQEGKP